MPAAAGPDTGERRGLFYSLRRLASTGVEIAHTRLEILSNELEEERARLGSILITGAVALFCFFMATTLFAVLILVLLWETHRVLALAVMGAMFLVGGILSWRSFQQQRQDRPGFLSATLGELAKDRKELGSG